MPFTRNRNQIRHVIKISIYLVFDWKGIHIGYESITRDMSRNTRPSELLQFMNEFSLSN